MIKNKKAGKSLEEIGIRWYKFDFKSEREIYCYLCCCHEKKKKLQKLDKELKFVSYRQWKQYIWNRYEYFDKDMLIEFSRYLNLRVRNIMPSREFWNIIATITLTFIFTKFMNMILNAKMDFNEVSAWSAIVFIFLLELSTTLALVFIFNQVFSPILDNNVDENLLKDYKEIIDEIINDKEKFKQEK